MKRFFEHVGKVEEGDTYAKTIKKVEQGIKKLTNQATARYKLFQEMPQDGQSFDSWVQFVLEQAKRCDGLVMTRLQLPEMLSCIRLMTGS